MREARDLPPEQGKILAPQCVSEFERTTGGNSRGKAPGRSREKKADNSIRPPTRSSMSEGKCGADHRHEKKRGMNNETNSA